MSGRGRDSVEEMLDAGNCMDLVARPGADRYWKVQDQRPVDVLVDKCLAYLPFLKPENPAVRDWGCIVEMVQELGRAVDDYYVCALREVAAVRCHW